MRYSLTLPILAVLALEAVAHPMKHQHLHARRADTVLNVAAAKAEPAKRDQYNDPAFAADHPDIDFAAAYRKGMGIADPSTPAAPKPAAPTPAPKPATGNAFVQKEKVETKPETQPETKPAAKPVTVDLSTADIPSGVAGMSVSKMVSTASKWFDEGSNALGALKNAVNVGSFGKAACTGDACGGDMHSLGNFGIPYGSNMMLVDSIEGQDYSVEFTNSSPDPLTVVVCNKAGADGNPFTGQATCLSAPALAFPLATGATQAVAFQAGSNFIFAPLQADTGKILSGAPDTVWGEANFLFSGAAFDVSSIASSTGNSYKLTMTDDVTGCTSSESENHWVSPTGTTSLTGVFKDKTDQASCADSCCHQGFSETFHIKATFGGSV